VGGNSSFEMLLLVYLTTWRHSPQDSNPGGHNRFLYLFLLKSALRMQSSQNVTSYSIYYSIFFLYIMSIKLRLYLVLQGQSAAYYDLETQNVQD
jgi:hypothetical protein